ncbi:MAG: hypothetical protein WA581_12720 [Candidatus Acidiferrales bacterium]
MFANTEDPLWLIGRTYRKLYNILVETTYPFASNGGDLWIDYTCELDRSTAHRIQLGRFVLLRRDCRLQVLAPPQETGEPIITLDSVVDVGAGSTISAKNRIHLEREVTLGQSVLVMDHGPAHEDVTVPVRHQGVTEGGRIRIAKGCFVGQGTVIRCERGELVLGQHSVVAAHSLITRSFPPYSLIAGNPARIVQQFDPEKKMWVLGGTRLKPAQQNSGADRHLPALSSSG